MVAVPSIGRADQVTPQRAAPEAEATRALYERYARQIYAYCLHQLGNREEAEDATQSTFLNAFRGLQRGVDPEFESAWLYKIAQNVCLTRQRSSSRRRRVESPGDLDAMQDVLPSHQADSDELIRLPEALESMPEQQRRALLLREWQGLSYKEIGDELGLSQAAVETLLFRARRSLAAGLSEEPKVGVGKKLRRSGDAGSLLALVKTLLFSGGAKLAATVATVAAGSVLASTPSVRNAVVQVVAPPTHHAAASAAAVSTGPVLAPRSLVPAALAAQVARASAPAPLAPLAPRDARHMNAALVPAIVLHTGGHLPTSIEQTFPSAAVPVAPAAPAAPAAPPVQAAPPPPPAQSAPAPAPPAAPAPAPVAPPAPKQDAPAPAPAPTPPTPATPASPPAAPQQQSGDSGSSTQNDSGSGASASPGNSASAPGQAKKDDGGSSTSTQPPGQAKKDNGGSSPQPPGQAKKDEGSAPAPPAPAANTAPPLQAPAAPPTATVPAPTPPAVPPGQAKKDGGGSSGQPPGQAKKDPPPPPAPAPILAPAPAPPPPPVTTATTTTTSTTTTLPAPPAPAPAPSAPPWSGNGGGGDHGNGNGGDHGNNGNGGGDHGNGNGGDHGNGGGDHGGGKGH